VSLTEYPDTDGGDAREGQVNSLGGKRVTLFSSRSFFASTEIAASDIQDASHQVAVFAQKPGASFLHPSILGRTDT
jgi:hypothetical protein